MHLFNRLRTGAAATALASTLLHSAIPSATAGEAGGKLVKPMLEEKVESCIHGLLNLEFSDHYITPRGLNVENQGLVFQPLFLLFGTVYKGDGFINSVTINTGVWNSIHSKPSNLNTTTRAWNEFDFIAGISTKFAKDFEASVTYLMFTSPIDAFATSHHLEFKLGYSDSFLKPITFNPYAKLFVELVNKATVASEESYNIEVGFAPTYVFEGYPVAVSLPSFITFPGDTFYSTDSTVGLISTGLKVTVPLQFIPECYGSWSVHAGVTYYHLENEGLKTGNALLPSGDDDADLVQLSGGLTIFF